MTNYEEYAAQARAIYQQGLENVKNKPVPVGQKYPPGTRVKITNNLGHSMRHFYGGKEATVMYTYAHAYWENNVKDYCLDIDGIGQVSWYHEHQLQAI